MLLLIDCKDHMESKQKCESQDDESQTMLSMFNGMSKVDMEMRTEKYLAKDGKVCVCFLSFGIKYLGS